MRNRVRDSVATLVNEHVWRICGSESAEIGILLLIGILFLIKRSLQIVAPKPRQKIMTFKSARNRTILVFLKKDGGGQSWLFSCDKSAGGKRSEDPSQETTRQRRTTTERIAGVQAGRYRFVTVTNISLNNKSTHSYLKTVEPASFAIEKKGDTTQTQGVHHP